MLEELADPAAVVTRHGKLTVAHGFFCNASLSDDRSKAAGFGETCSKNCSLHEQWKIWRSLPNETQ